MHGLLVDVQQPAAMRGLLSTRDQNANGGGTRCAFLKVEKTEWVGILVLDAQVLEGLHDVLRLGLHLHDEAIIITRILRSLSLRYSVARVRLPCECAGRMHVKRVRSAYAYGGFPYVASPVFSLLELLAALVSHLFVLRHNLFRMVRLVEQR